ncbi:hypothetical protein KD576_004203 [Salmonella enterica subsp. enterica serovar Thompson]|nr:hypothetical protein [Salmonella enterica]EHP7123061.1 hypothetical protein [Salmonella enterica subsp. enterica serovar Thompson]EGN2541054.1 hypothetical protein [Salmonella enterica]EHP7219067.1 hypothetical protein [Salmonella enterica subsp. enterica serovar Thompson]HAF3525081.1 hypothetical protein [Salmonella enterica]
MTDIPVEAEENAIVWDVREAVAAFLALSVQDDDIISHEAMAALIQVPVEHPEMKAGMAADYRIRRMERFKTLRNALLNDHGLWLRSEQGKGYRLVHPQQQASMAARDLTRRLHKYVALANQIISHTRTDAMTNHERQKHLAAEMKLASAAESINATRRNIFKEILHEVEMQELEDETE